MRDRFSYTSGQQTDAHIVATPTSPVLVISSSMMDKAHHRELCCQEALPRLEAALHGRDGYRYIAGLRCLTTRSPGQSAATR